MGVWVFDTVLQTAAFVVFIKIRYAVDNTTPNSHRGNSLKKLTVRSVLGLSMVINTILNNY